VLPHFRPLTSRCCVFPGAHTSTQTAAKKSCGLIGSRHATCCAPPLRAQRVRLGKGQVVIAFAAARRLRLALCGVLRTRSECPVCMPVAAIPIIRTHGFSLVRTVYCPGRPAKAAHGSAPFCLASSSIIGSRRNPEFTGNQPPPEPGALEFGIANETVYPGIASLTDQCLLSALGKSASAINGSPRSTAPL